MPRRPYLRTAPRSETGTASTVPISNLLETADPTHFPVEARLLSFMIIVSQRMRFFRSQHQGNTPRVEDIADRSPALTR